jgi:excisionase family DNA binding protein
MSENKTISNLGQRLTLFTAQEVASILKMNTQVVTRKLSSGELEGYKIGKEWRISEEQVIHFLEKYKNNTKQDQGDKIVKTFIKNGKLIDIPATRSKRELILKYLVSKLDNTKIYSEKEINDFIKNYHQDVCTIRREFIGYKLMVRKDGKYKKVSWK